MRETIKIISGAVAFVLITDVAGFMLWVLSGQYPADSFYIGTITAHILRAIL